MSWTEKSIFPYWIVGNVNVTDIFADLKVLSDENQGGSKLVSIDSIFFTV